MHRILVSVLPFAIWNMKVFVSSNSYVDRALGKISYSCTQHREVRCTCSRLPCSSLYTTVYLVYTLDTVTSNVMRDV